MQHNLFTSAICHHCKKNPGCHYSNPYLWKGFFDLDTKQHVCNKCKEQHYAEKFKIDKFKGLYRESPVMVSMYW